MSSIKTLYNRIQTFINDNKSGIIAFCSSPSMKGAFEYMAYIRSLEYIYVVTDSYLCYFPVDIGKGAHVRPSRAGGSRPAIIFSV